MNAGSEEFDREMNYDSSQQNIETRKSVERDFWMISSDFFGWWLPK